MKKKYLETSKYPKAFLRVKDVTLPPGWEKLDKFLLTFDSQLEIHGVVKRVSCELKANKKEGVTFIEVVTNTTLKNHRIKTPGYMGVKVADKVAINVKFHLK